MRRTRYRGGRWHALQMGLAPKLSLSMADAVPMPLVPADCEAVDLTPRQMKADAKTTDIIVRTTRFSIDEVAKWTEADFERAKSLGWDPVKFRKAVKDAQK